MAWSRPSMTYDVDASKKLTGASANLNHVLGFINAEVDRLKENRIQMELCIREVVAEAKLGRLRRCRLELVGSVSWNGDVPQSDVDMMLCTPNCNGSITEAIALLQELRMCLLSFRHDRWKRIDVLSTAKVPILSLEDTDGCCCDISVDQMRAIHHRDYLLQALDGRQEVRDLIRLVKFWLRLRGLPLGFEGGIPSLAWVFAALSFADQQPRGTSLEVLTMHFFSELHTLGTRFLNVGCDRLGSLNAVWQDGFIANWTAEWTELFRVEDPTSPGYLITPPSLPTALGLLYVADLRLVWSSIRDNQWDKIWIQTESDAVRHLPSIFASDFLGRNNICHLVLQDGLLYIGWVHDVEPCPGLPSVEVLHRRDQSSQLHMRLYEGGSRLESRSNLSFQPCHWICTAPPQEMMVRQGISISRIVEFACILGMPRLSPGLQNIVIAVEPSFGSFVCTQAPAYTCVLVPLSVLMGGQCGGETQNVTFAQSEGGSEKQVARRDTQSCRSQIEDATELLPTTRKTKGLRMQANALVKRRDAEDLRCKSNQTRSNLIDLASDQSTQASDVEDAQIEKGRWNDICMTGDSSSNDSHVEISHAHGDSVEIASDVSLPSSDLEDLQFERGCVECHQISALQDVQFDNSSGSGHSGLSLHDEDEGSLDFAQDTDISALPSQCVTPDLSTDDVPIAFDACDDCTNMSDLDEEAQKFIMHAAKETAPQQVDCIREMSMPQVPSELDQDRVSHKSIVHVAPVTVPEQVDGSSEPAKSDLDEIAEKSTLQPATVLVAQELDCSRETCSPRVPSESDTDEIATTTPAPTAAVAQELDCSREASSPQVQSGSDLDEVVEESTLRLATVTVARELDCSREASSLHVQSGSDLDEVAEESTMPFALSTAPQQFECSREASSSQVPSESSYEDDLGSVEEPMDGHVEQAVCGASSNTTSARVQRRNVNPVSRSTARKANTKRKGVRAKGSAASDANFKSSSLEDELFLLELPDPEPIHCQSANFGHRQLLVAFLVGLLLAVLAGLYLNSGRPALSGDTQDYDWVAVAPRSGLHRAGSRTVGAVFKQIQVQIARGNALAKRN